MSEKLPLSSHRWNRDLVCTVSFFRITELFSLLSPFCLPPKAGVVGNVTHRTVFEPKTPSHIVRVGRATMSYSRAPTCGILLPASDQGTPSCTRLPSPSSSPSFLNLLGGYVGAPVPSLFTSLSGRACRMRQHESAGSKI